MPEYIISQRDPRGERTEQLAAVKAAHTYNLEYGFPVAAGPDDGNGPSTSWQLKAVEEQELIRANLVAMRRRGRWDFVNDLQPLAPRRLATMVHEQRCRRAHRLLHARAGRPQEPRSAELSERVPGHLRDHQDRPRSWAGPNPTSTSPR